MPVCNDLFGEKTIFILSAGLLGCWRGGWGWTLNTLKGLKPITRYKHGVYLNDRPIILPRSYFLVVATCFKVVLMAYVNFSHKPKVRPTTFFFRLFGLWYNYYGTLTIKLPRKGIRRYFNLYLKSMFPANELTEKGPLLKSDILFGLVHSREPY